ncbi:MAG: GIY-YIG nuclease family protein [candidate division FCPU426 bacterium]
MSKTACLYILSNDTRTVMALGAASNLKNFLDENRPGRGHSCMALVYYERFYELAEAQARVEALRRQPRQARHDLVSSLNPEWKDLAGEL